MMIEFSTSAFDWLPGADGSPGSGNETSRMMQTGHDDSEWREVLQLLELEDVTAVTLRCLLSSGTASIRVSKRTAGERPGPGVVHFSWAATAWMDARCQEWTSAWVYDTALAAYHAALHTILTDERLGETQNRLPSAE